MATDYAIQGPTRICAVTGQTLQPGDPFYAVLTEVDGNFVRTDYSAPAWPGPPAQAIAHWAGRVPHADKPRVAVFDDGLLLDCFDHLTSANAGDKVAFRFVVALLLMRRKRLKFEDHRRLPDGRDVLVLHDPRSGTRHEVHDPRLGETELEATQNEVFALLGWGE